jgi:hypothetical protein
VSTLRGALLGEVVVAFVFLVLASFFLAGLSALTAGLVGLLIIFLVRVFRHDILLFFERVFLFNCKTLVADPRVEVARRACSDRRGELFALVFALLFLEIDVFDIDRFLEMFAGLLAEFALTARAALAAAGARPWAAFAMKPAASPT